MKAFGRIIALGMLRLAGEVVILRRFCAGGCHMYCVKVKDDCLLHGL